LSSCLNIATVTPPLSSIETLAKAVPDDFTEPNFRLCTEISDLQNGKPQPFYSITRDGFALLAMGFTGKKATEFKVAYNLTPLSAFGHSVEDCNMLQIWRLIRFRLDKHHSPGPEHESIQQPVFIPIKHYRR
jgi:hypothetical protein